MGAFRILVVDDNALLRGLLVQALESAGYVGLAADCAEAALDVLRFDPPDLCVVDHVMPGMSGAALIRALRSSPDPRLRAVPCLGLTGFAGADVELLSAGAIRVIRKPVQEAQLIEAIRRELERPATPAEPQPARTARFAG